METAILIMWGCYAQLYGNIFELPHFQRIKESLNMTGPLYAIGMLHRSKITIETFCFDKLDKMENCHENTENHCTQTYDDSFAWARIKVRLFLFNYFHFLIFIQVCCCYFDNCNAEFYETTKFEAKEKLANLIPAIEARRAKVQERKQESEEESVRKKEHKEQQNEAEQAERQARQQREQMWTRTASQNRKNVFAVAIVAFLLIVQQM